MKSALQKSFRVPQEFADELDKWNADKACSMERPPSLRYIRLGWSIFIQWPGPSNLQHMERWWLEHYWVFSYPLPVSGGPSISILILPCGRTPTGRSRGILGPIYVIRLGPRSSSRHFNPWLKVCDRMRKKTEYFALPVWLQFYQLFLFCSMYSSC